MKKASKILSLALVLCMLFSLAAMSASASDYTDVDDNAWYADGIARWTGYSIVEGYDDGSFRANDFLTRAEAATFLVRLTGYKALAENLPFTDVTADRWFYEYVSIAYNAGIVNGTSAYTYSPNAELTRQEFFVMLARALGLPESDSMDKTFTDAGKIGSWALGYINTLVSYGILDGYEDGTLRPTTNITRGEAMVMLDKTIEVYANEDGATVSSEGGIVLVVADDVTVEAAEGSVIAVIGDNVTINAEEGAIIAVVSDEIETITVVAPEDAEEPITVVINGEEVEIPAGATAALVEDEDGNVTVEVTEPEDTTKPDDSSSSGSGSSGGGTFIPDDEDDVPVYAITVAEVANAEVKVQADAEEGETVTVTVTPAEGFHVVSILVNGTEIEGNTFKMPAEEVEVSAVIASNIGDITFKMITPNDKEYEAVGLEDVDVTNLTFESATAVVKFGGVSYNFDVKKVGNDIVMESLDKDDAAKVASWSDYETFATKSDGGSVDSNLNADDIKAFVGEDSYSITYFQTHHRTKAEIADNIGSAYFALSFGAGQYFSFDGFKITADIDFTAKLSFSGMDADLSDCIAAVGVDLTEDELDDELFEEDVFALLNMLEGRTITLELIED